jgi:hypothetical protein
MIVLRRHVAAVAALLLLAAGLAACGDNEPDQRKAFIAFLQTRMLDRPGVHIPRPTDAELQSFGPYANDFAILRDFVTDSDIAAFNQKINDALPQLRSAKDLVDRRVEIRASGEGIRELLKLSDVKLAATDKAHAALKQPDDLKAVYDAVYDKVIVKPMAGFHESIPIALDIVTAAANFGDYMYAHRDKVKIVGTSVQASDPKTQAEVNALAAALNSNAPRMNDAQRRLRIVLQGT